MEQNPKLFLVIDQAQARSDDRFTLLSESAKQRDVDVIQFNPDTIDWSALPVLAYGSMLYRITIGRRAGVLERLLIHEHVATLFRDNLYSMRPMGDLAAAMLEERAGIPIVPTIHDFTSDRDLLARYVRKLGGFPVIVKRMGGSRGVGVMRIDSMESLLSLADALLDAGDPYIMRRYIPNATHVRLIALDDQVVSCVEYPRIEDDFRTNATAAPAVIPYQPTEEMCRVAVATVISHGFEFGGVDLLLDETGNMFVAESNFPCYFPRAQRATGDDVSGMMIDHLLRKRDALLAAGQ